MQYQKPIIGQGDRDFNEKMETYKKACNTLPGLSAPERDVSPIQAEIRAANDALDLLHLRIHTLTDRLGPALIQRGQIASNGNAVPEAQKSGLGRDISTIYDRVADASAKIDEVLSCLHL